MSGHTRSGSRKTPETSARPELVARFSWRRARRGGSTTLCGRPAAPVKFSRKVSVRSLGNARSVAMRSILKTCQSKIERTLARFKHTLRRTQDRGVIIVPQTVQRFSDAAGGQVQRQCGGRRVPVGYPAVSALGSEFAVATA